MYVYETNTAYIPVTIGLCWYACMDPGIPRAGSQFLFCLNYHKSQARSVFKNYCNFSSTLPANVFSFLCQLLFACQMVMMIHNFDHGHYVLFLFYFFLALPTPTTTNPSRRCQRKLLSLSYKIIIK